MPDSLGLEPGVVRLVEYDAQWPALFIAEQQRIREQCRTLMLRLERRRHLNPRYVREADLDIAAGRPRDSSIRDCVAALEKAGYEHRGERGVPGRLYLSARPTSRVSRAFG